MSFLSVELEIEYCLREQLHSQRLAMLGLASPDFQVRWLTDEDRLIGELIQNLEWGRLVLVAPSSGGSRDNANDRAWKAYDSFQAQVGREFQVAMRTHRLVPRERVAAIRQGADFDVVPAQEAVAIIANVAQSRGGGRTAPTIQALLDSILDLRSPPQADGFVLLRAPITGENGKPWAGMHTMSLPSGLKVSQPGRQDGLHRTTNLVPGTCEVSIPKVKL